MLELWDKVPDAAVRIGASHLEALEQASSAANAADEEKRGVAFASEALKEIDPAAEPVRTALLLETRAAMNAHLGWDDPAIDLRAALDLVPPGVDDAARARVLLSEAKYTPGDPHGPRAVAAAEEALSLARAAGDAAVHVTALCALAMIEESQGRDAQALDLFAEARTFAEGTRLKTPPRCASRPRPFDDQVSPYCTVQYRAS